MKVFRILGVACAVTLASGSAGAAWTQAPSGVSRSVEKGVAVWRGKASAGALPGEPESARTPASVRILARVSCDRRRTLSTHGFFAGVQRHHLSRGAFPGDVYGGY